MGVKQAGGSCELFLELDPIPGIESKDISASGQPTLLTSSMTLFHLLSGIVF